MTTLPGAATNIFDHRVGTTASASLNITNTGSLRIRDGTTNGTAFTNNLVTGQWYRLEMKLDLNTPLATARIFTGANLNGTTPDEEITGPITSTAIDTAYIGTNAVITTGDLFWDADATGHTDWIGPLGGGAGTIVKTDAPTTVNKSASDTGGLVVTETPAAGGGGPIDFAEHFEGAGNGVAATTTTTAFAGQVGGAAYVTHSTNQSISGTPSLRIQNPTSTASLYRTPGSSTILYRRVYWRAADLTNGTILWQRVPVAHSRPTSRLTTP